MTWRLDMPKGSAEHSRPSADALARLNAPNREAWLTALIEALRPMVSVIGELPKIRVGCGFPARGAAARNRVVGQCWSALRSADNTFEIFISPVLDDPFEVAHTLLHELIHAIIGTEHGHKGPFKRAMRRVGLVGPAPASIPGDALAGRLRDNILPDLGQYPHAELDPTPRKMQSTRLLKAICESCGCTIRLPKKWIIDPGPPLCACSQIPMVVERGKL